jgi:hypothetical protein
MKIDCTQQEWDELKEFASKRYISTKTRFHVEDAIDQVAQTVHDMDALIELYVDGRKELSVDEVWNYLDGIKNVLSLRVQLLWDAHRQRECIDGYGTIEEVMATKFSAPATVTTPKKKAKKK